MIDHNYPFHLNNKTVLLA
uniref:Uncharacterized protein n=1 Tax=Arundo donax TaxID=35708 RepID=A0A0A9HDC3_ARUDO